MDIAVLTGLLSAALPFLMKIGDKAAESAGSKMGTDAWEMAKKIWEKLHPKVQEKPEVLSAAQAVAASPDDEDSRDFLQKKLTKLLQENPDLEAAIAQILQGNPAVAAGTQVNVQSNQGVVAGNISGGSVIGSIGTVQGDLTL